MEITSEQDYILKTFQLRSARAVAGFESIINIKNYDISIYFHTD